MNTIEYPAVIYKSNQNNSYIANCVMYNLIGFGKTEADAINNLEKSMNEIIEDFNIIIKPISKMALCKP